MREGSTSRAKIARITGLTAATVSDLVAELLDENLAMEVGTGPSAGGKPPTLLDLKASARSVVAIDLSDGSRTGWLLDLKGTPIGEPISVTDAAGGADGVRDLAATIDELVAAAPSPLLGIGVGTPGIVDGSGVVIEASNLQWHQVPLESILAERFTAPIHVINNSRAAAIAEYSWGGHGAENLLAIKFGRGIGAGIVLDGRIHDGEDSSAGEIGHVVVDPDGPSCFCGKQGCLETLAAIPHLIERLEPLVGGSPSTREILQRAAQGAEAGDAGVITVINEAAAHIAKVLATTVAILDIHRVVVTGTVAALGDEFLEHIRVGISEAVLSTLAAKLELCYGTTGDMAVPRGAAAFVIQQELGVV